MSKVVHLSNDAHTQAKLFCKETGVRMSDWVADLIKEAIARQDIALAEERDVVGRKKPLHRLEERTVQVPEEAVPAYAMPPFWKRQH